MPIAPVTCRACAIRGASLRHADQTGRRTGGRERERGNRQDGDCQRAFLVKDPPGRLIAESGEAMPA